MSEVNSLSVVCSDVGPDEKPVGETFHVFDICLGAHPAGGDYRTYLLERVGSCWKLWLKVFEDECFEAYSDGNDPDEGGVWLYGVQAVCDVSGDALPEEVAKVLIKASWTEEARIYDTDFSNLKVIEAGLLNGDGLAVGC